MTDNRAICLLSQMYLPQFDDEEKEALTWAIKCIQESEEYRAELKEFKAMYVDKVAMMGIKEFWKRVRDYVTDLGYTHVILFGDKVLEEMER